ncbi:MAG TPA: helix-turn-helix domain-containing protein [Bradyrhizobium sp.]|nr:helix-turn-helix domain-containing protein [Bradyrhizobium sp.]
MHVTRPADFDHFRNIERLGDARSIPLELKGFAASFAAVTLKSCAIYLQLTFPRILQATYRTGGAIIGFGMDDEVTATVNGAGARPPMVLLTRGCAPCELVEPRANLVAFINFDAIDDRDWPGEAGRAQLIRTGAAELEALRAVIRNVIALASNSAAFAQPHVIENLEESVLQAVDRVMLAAPAVEGRRANLTQYLALVRRLDEHLAFNASQTLYSAELAKQLGVSVRTLHNAVVTIRGMSMHRYVRLRRLWTVRQQLVQGASTAVIKAIALANGFWHMGEFSSLYRTTFGETPQQTLAAARGQRR